MSATTVNYTDEMVARLREVYKPEDSEAAREEQIENLATELDRTVRSIRAKLTREGLYVAKAKAPAGKRVIRKDQLIMAIAAKLQVAEEELDSLSKANKAVLALIASRL